MSTRYEDHHPYLYDIEREKLQGECDGWEIGRTNGRWTASIRVDDYQIIVVGRHTQDIIEGVEKQEEMLLALLTDTSLSYSSLD